MSFHLNKLKSLLLLSIIVSTFISCHNFYKASRVSVNGPSKTIDSLQQKSRYFILRDGEKAYYMNEIALSEDKKSLSCTLDSLPENHKLYLTHGRKGRMQYFARKTSDLAVLSEVHFYINPTESTSFGQYTLSLDKVQKIEVIEKDWGKTNGSYIIGALGYTVGAIIVVGIIVAATKSSCPFISAYTGSEFELQGEIYGGAIYPQLAREDYMPLRMQPTADGRLMIKISNELKEKQYTDVANLLVISHDKNSRVLADARGNLYSISHPMAPLKAWTSNNPDALSLLTKKDDQVLRFDDTLTASSSNYLVTQFKNEHSSSKAKLILSIKNSYWVDYLYSDLAKQFGNYYGTYVKKQNQKPAAELIKWAKEQHLPLEVSIKTKTGWQKVTDLTTIGPLACREVVVPLDLTNVDENNIEIKLSSGFMFWEIDYAAIDFSQDANFSVQKISPATAVDETGKDVLPALSKIDDKFLEQPVPGNVVTLEYACKPAPENISRSYILQTRGYYIHSWDFKGKPNFAFLKTLKRPDAFSSYSLALYKKFVSNNSVASVVGK